MNLKSIVDAELQKRGKTFKWLVGELEMSNDGLKAGLEKESIKLSDFKKLIQVLNLPIQMLFEAGSTYQNIQGKYNQQVSGGYIASEPEGEYKKIEVEGLRRQVELLERQIDDKNRIIELLSKA